MGAGLPLDPNVETLGAMACRQHCACPLGAESLKCPQSPHLLLRFESNGFQRHMRVAPLSMAFGQNSSGFARSRKSSPIAARSAPVSHHSRRITLESVCACTRRAMRRRRRALSAAARRQAALAVRDRLSCTRLLRPGMRVGVYLAVNGELDTAPTIALVRRRGCQVFVPLVRSHRAGAMWFVPLSESLRDGRFGIPEPQMGRHARVSARWLDLVLVPVVAFGSSGERLGSGAGFFDHASSYLHTRRTWRKPLLVGLAYHWQLVARLPAQPGCARSLRSSPTAICTLSTSVASARSGAWVTGCSRRSPRRSASTISHARARRSLVGRRAQLPGAQHAAG